MSDREFISRAEQRRHEAFKTPARDVSVTLGRSGYLEIEITNIKPETTCLIEEFCELVEYRAVSSSVGSVTIYRYTGKVFLAFPIIQKVIELQFGLRR